MKTIRLILFIPAMIIAMIIANFLYELLISFFQSNPDDIFPLQFIWDSFIKAILITTAAAFTAIYVYPFERKKPALIAISIIYILLYSILTYTIFGLGEYIKDFKLSNQSIISQVAYLIGTIVALGYVWKEYYFDEM